MRGKSAPVRREGTLTAMIERPENAGSGGTARETLFGEIFDAVNAALFALDARSGVIIGSNRQVTALYGYTPAELQGRAFESMRDGETPPEPRAWLEQAAAGKEQLFEWRIKNKSGGTSWAQLCVRRAGDYLLVTALDSTGRKKAEAVLDEQARFYRQIFENTKDSVAVFEVMPDGRLRYLTLNDAAARRAGLTAEKTIGHYPEEFIAPEIAAAIQARGRRCVATGESAHYEDTFIWPSGERNTEVVFIPLKDAAGQVARVLTVAHDMTERVQREKALRHSEELLDAVQHIGNIGYWEMDFVAGRITGSAEAVRMLGVPPETVPRTLDEFVMHVHPDDRVSMRHTLEQALLKNRSLCDQQFRIVRPDGEVRHVHGRCRADYDAKGTPVYAVAITQDVTGAIQTQQRLRRSEQRFRTLIDRAPFAMSIILKGDIEYANTRFLRLHGYDSFDEARGQPAIDLMIAPESRPLARERQRMREEGLPVPDQYEITGYRKDGSRFPMLISISRIELEEGVVTIGVDIDISDRKRIEAALRESEAKLRVIMDKSPVAITWSDAKGNIEYVNEQFCALFGYTRDDVPTIDEWLRRVYPDPAYRSLMLGIRRNNIAKAAHARQIIPQEIAVTAKNGDVRYAMAIIAVSGERVITIYNDITDRKRAEMELRASEELYRQVMDNTQDSVNILDVLPDGRFIYRKTNPVLVQTLKMPLPQIIGRHPEDIFPPGLAAHINASLRRCVQSGTVVHLDEELPFADRTRMTETALTPLKDETGRVYRIVAVSHDITERGQAEMALQESEQRFRTLIEKAPFAMSIQREGRVLYGNARFLQLFGYDRLDELFGHDAMELIAPQSRPMVDERQRRRARSDDVRGEYEAVGLRRDGSQFPFIIAVTRLELEEGMVSVVTSIDISARKKAEMALRESEQMYRQVLDNTQDAVAVVDVMPDGRFAVVKINATLMSRFSARPGRIPGKYPEDLFPPPVAAQMNRSHRRCVAEGKTVRMEEEFAFPQGMIIAETTLTPLKDETGRVYRIVVVSHDITERKRREEALRHSETVLKEAQVIGHVGSWEQDLPAGELRWSDELYRITGISPGTPISIAKTIDELPHPDDREIVRASYEALFRDKKPGDIHMRIVRPSGEVRVVHGKSRIEFNDKGVAVRVIGIIQDVTEQVRAQEDLQKSERRFRTLIEKAPLAISVVREGIIEYVNNNFVRLYGYTNADELRGRDILGFIAPQTRTLAAERQRLRAQGIDVPREYEATGLRKDGSQFPFILAVTRIELVEGMVSIITSIDISARKQVEMALRRSEQRFRTLIEKAPLAINIQAQGKITYANDRFLKMFGYKNQEEIIGRPLLDTVAPRSRPMVAERMRLRAEGKRVPNEYEIIGLRKDGSEFPYLVAITRVELEEGVVSIAMNIDISDRKKAEEALQKSEQRFRVLIEKAPLPISIHREGRIVYVNDSFLKLYGYDTLDELRGAPALHVIAPQSRALVGERQRLRAQGVAVPARYEAVGLRKDGSQFPFIIALTRIELEEGMVSVVIDIDITEQKRAEAALRESEAKLRVIMDKSPAAITWADRQGHIEYINEKFYDLFGYALQEIPTVDAWMRRAYPDPAYRAEVERIRRESIEQSLSSGQPITREIIITRKDGTTRYVISLVAATHERVIIIYSDITDRKKAEMALQESYVQLQKSLNSIIDTITAVVETRDPFTAGHQQRVSQLSAAIAAEMHLPGEQVESIRIAALLHDVGKIYVPSEILSKPGRLSGVEVNILKAYPRASYDILKKIDFPWPVAKITLEHQERYNGSGYPQGLSSEHILLEARILAVADTVEAMISHRPYRPAQGWEAAIDEITKNRGILYDPEVVDAILRLVKEKRLVFTPTEEEEKLKVETTG